MNTAVDFGAGCQVELDKDSKNHFTHITNLGKKNKYTCLPMGLTWSSDIAQKLMENAFF